MRPKNSLAALIAKAGNTVSLWGTDTAWQAIVEPLRYRNKLYVEETAVAAGMIDRTAFLYIGLPENDLTVYPRGTLFACNGQLMTMAHCETTFVGDRKRYVWAVFNRYGTAEDRTESQEGTGG